jgi:hypothetical protein
MSPHRHLSSEDIFERLSEDGSVSAAAGCETCESEVAAFTLFLAELKRVDAESLATSDWDDLLLRKRIREAVALEKPYRPSVFARFLILRPVLVSALVAGIALVVWSPLSLMTDPGPRPTSFTQVASARIPAWTPLPDESEDEGLKVLAAWTPNEDEVAIARCHSACLSGLSDHEEQNLMNSVTAPAPAAQSPRTEASPL